MISEKKSIEDELLTLFEEFDISEILDTLEVSKEELELLLENPSLHPDNNVNNTPKVNIFLLLIFIIIHPFIGKRFPICYNYYYHHRHC